MSKITDKVDAFLQERSDLPYSSDMAKGASMYVIGRRDGDKEKMDRAHRLLLNTIGGRAGELMKALDEKFFNQKRAMSA